MAARKLLFVFTVLAGLFAFQGTMAEALPRERTRTEVVIGFEAHASVKSAKQRRPRLLIKETFRKAQIAHPHLATLLISSIYHHSSL